MSNTRRVVLATLVGTFAWTGSAWAQEHGHSDADGEHEVAAVLEAVFAATQAGDLEALGELYAGDDLTIVEGAGMDRGWTNYRDHHLKPELDRFEEFSFTPRNIEVQVSGEMAWAHFEYDLLIKMGEREMDRVGRGTAVFERRGDRWVVRHMQTANRARS